MQSKITFNREPKLINNGCFYQKDKRKLLWRSGIDKQNKYEVLDTCA